MRTLFIALAILVAGCARSSTRELEGASAQVGDASIRSYERFAEEAPPCNLPPLEESEVVAAALAVLGSPFLDVEGMPRRPYRISAFRCVYRFEYAILSHGKEWFPLDAIHASAEVLVARDLNTWSAGTAVGAIDAH